MNRSDALNSLIRLHLGMLTAVCLYMVVKLRIADHISNNVRQNDKLASEVGLHPKVLSRVMRLLCSENVFHEGPDGVYSLTPMSELMRTDIEGSFSPFIEANTEVCFDVLPGFVPALLQDSVPMEYRHGIKAFDWISSDPALSEIWQKAYTGVHWPETEAVMKACDFSDTRVFADIGGGHGEVVRSFLDRYSDASAVIFDLPIVIKQSGEKFHELGLAEKCEFVAGDFFKGIPVKADTYFLRHILHDWNDDECITILRNICESAEPGSRLLIAECVLKGPNDPDIGKFFDIEMLMGLTGLERTADEYESLLTAAGVEFKEVIHTESVISVVEGVIR